MISYRFVPISSQKGVLFLRHPVHALSKVPKAVVQNFFVEFSHYKVLEWHQYK